MFICCAVIIVIIQYCNFCQLSYWMRSALATLVGLALLAFLFVSLCRYAILKTHVATVMLDVSYISCGPASSKHICKKTSIAK